MSTVGQPWLGEHSDVSKQGRSKLKGLWACKKAGREAGAPLALLQHLCSWELLTAGGLIGLRTSCESLVFLVAALASHRTHPSWNHGRVRLEFAVLIDDP